MTAKTKEKKQRDSALNTRRWIAESLFDLMDKKDFARITIKEIVENADVSRQSFYRHFTTKEDIVHNYLATTIVADFEEQFRALGSIDLEEVLTLYFRFWLRHLDFSKKAFKTVFPLHQLENYEHLLRFNLSKSLYIITDELDIQNSKEMDVIVHFIIGGLYNVKRTWLDAIDDYTPEELAGILTKFIRS